MFSNNRTVWQVLIFGGLGDVSKKEKSFQRQNKLLLIDERLQLIFNYTQIILFDNALMNYTR